LNGWSKALQLFIHFQNFQLSKKAFRCLSRWCHLSTYPLRPLKTWSIKGAEPCHCLAPKRSWQRDIDSTKHKKTNYVMKKLIYIINLSINWNVILNLWKGIIPLFWKWVVVVLFICSIS
jgi:hypothetical protein